MSAPARTRRVAIALAGLHRVVRGAEVAFESMARELARIPGFDVTLIGSGAPRAGEPYRFRRARCVPRERFERFPNVPCLRSEAAWEELTFAPGLAAALLRERPDLTVTCAYPHTSWVLRAARAPHVFVTQNGDWPAFARESEFRFFSCDGLVCTNPEYYARNRSRWNAVLIPNGVDPALFRPGPRTRGGLGLPEDATIVLMVSALIESKRVLEGIEAVARTRDLSLVVAGDGPLRDAVDALGRARLGARFRRVELPRERMPELYRAADAFLHMSRVEPSANAYLEALATGLPIVTEDREVTRFTLERHAELVDTRDLDAVAAALARALASDRAEARAERRALAERRFAWAGIAREYARFFEQVIERAA